MTNDSARIIAVVGPDGAGKSTLCEALRAAGIQVIYCGRGSGSQWYMRLANNLRAWLASPPLRPCQPLFMWGAYYLLESISWGSRLRGLRTKQAPVVVLERCMLDRLALLLKLEAEKGAGARFAQRALARIWFSRYWRLAREFAGVLVVTASPAELLARRPGFYRNEQAATAWSDAYRQLADKLSLEVALPVEIAPQFTVAEAVHQIRRFARIDESPNP